MGYVAGNAIVKHSPYAPGGRYLIPSPIPKVGYVAPPNWLSKKDAA